jgi:hypothetical protein
MQRPTRAGALEDKAKAAFYRAKHAIVTIINSMPPLLCPRPLHERKRAKQRSKDTEQLTAYEQERLDNVRKNNAVLHALGLAGGMGELMGKGAASSQPIGCASGGMGELMGEGAASSEPIGSASDKPAAYNLPQFFGKTFETTKKTKEVPTLMPTPSTQQRVRTVCAEPIPEEMPILVVFHRFIELILRGIKIVEMRQDQCPHIGERIALCSSGLGSREGGFVVLGTAVVTGQVCATNCTPDAWLAKYQRASCVGLEKWPSKYQWAWQLADVQAFDHPVRYRSWPTGEGMIWRYVKRGSWVVG